MKVYCVMRREEETPYFVLARVCQTEEVAKKWVQGWHRNRVITWTEHNNRGRYLVDNCEEYTINEEEIVEQVFY